MAAGQTAGVADRVLDGDLVPLTLRLHSCPDVAVAGDWPGLLSGTVAVTAHGTSVRVKDPGLNLHSLR